MAWNRRNRQNQRTTFERYRIAGGTVFHLGTSRTYTGEMRVALCGQEGFVEHSSWRAARAGRGRTCLTCLRIVRKAADLAGILKETR